MHREEFLALMEEIAPVSLADQEDLERIGLIVEGMEEIATVCCALDATPEIAEEAASTGASMLVVHHTPFFQPLLSIRGRAARILKVLLGAGTNLFVMHTNFDRAPVGVNRTLAEILGLKEVVEMPLGLVGECSLTPVEIARRLSAPLRVVGKADTISRLAIVGGSGFRPELLGCASRLGADAFLSAELKHHVALASPLPLLEAPHHVLESPAMRRLAEERGWRYIEGALETGLVR